MTTILVVDDEPMCLELMAGLLPKEYEIETALDGKEALIKVKETFTDLILLDILIPEINGYEVCRQLKSDKNTMCIPVVMVTSLMEKEDRIKSIEVGADDFLSKPVDTFELNARVKSLLRIKKYHDELLEMRKKAEDNLHNTLKKLARSKAELEQIVYIASRDLQQPLQAVSSNLELLGQHYKSKLPDKDACELVENAVLGTVTMQRRINDLFAYSHMATRKEPADTVSVLDRALSNLRLVIKKTGAEITHGKLPVVSGDQMQLCQLFHHLLDNAIKFRSTRPPQVHISVREERDDWVFSVQDNGMGIDPKYHDSIFLISEHIHETEPKTGIGLAICKKIVERHGGRIWMESQVGNGSTFYFTIPKSEGR